MTASGRIRRLLPGIPRRRERHPGDRVLAVGEHARGAGGGDPASPTAGQAAPRLGLSWGSAVGGNKNPEIYAAVVTLPAAR